MFLSVVTSFSLDFLLSYTFIHSYSLVFSNVYPSKWHENPVAVFPKPRCALKRPEIILPEKENHTQINESVPGTDSRQRRRRNLIPSFPPGRTSVVNGQEYKLYQFFSDSVQWKNCSQKLNFFKFITAMRIITLDYQIRINYNYFLLIEWYYSVKLLCLIIINDK